MINGIDPVALLTIAVALGIGGFVKGATGSGAPLVAVPIVAAFYDVTMGILMMVLPNIVMNAKQVWTYRANINPAQIAILMSVASIPGMLVGTRMLSSVSQDVLLTGLGLFLVAYLGLKLADPRFSISERVAVKSSVPVGFIGGIMQSCLAP